jgi:hypothetical protein
LFDEYVDKSTFYLQLSKQAPVYKSDDVAQSFGQNFENLLISLRIQNEYFPHPLLAYGYQWTDFKQEALLKIFSNSSQFNLLSGIANGVEIIIDLETYDSADIEEDGEGLGILIENNEDFPLMELDGFFVEPGKTAMIKVHPNIYSISKEALDNFDYIDRKCVGNNEIKIEYFSSYGLSNCLVSAAMTEIYENCNIDNNNTG